MELQAKLLCRRVGTRCYAAARRTGRAIWKEGAQCRTGYRRRYAYSSRGEGASCRIVLPTALQNSATAGLSTRGFDSGDPAQCNTFGKNAINRGGMSDIRYFTRRACQITTKAFAVYWSSAAMRHMVRSRPRRPLRCPVTAVGRLTRPPAARTPQALQTLLGREDSVMRVFDAAGRRRSVCALSGTLQARLKRC